MSETKLEVVPEFKPENAVEALADAWASIDGKLDDFRAGKTVANIEDFGGHYEGYLSDAAELERRLDARGYRLVRKPDVVHRGSGAGGVLV